MRTKLKIFLICFLLLCSALINQNAYAWRFFQGHSTWYEQIPPNPTLYPESSQIVQDFITRGTEIYVDIAAIPIYQADETYTDKVVTLSIDRYDYSWGTEEYNWNPVPLSNTSKPFDNDCRCLNPGSGDGEPHPNPYTSCSNNSDQIMIVISEDGTEIWDFYHAYTCDNGVSFTSNQIRRYRNSEDGVASHNTSDGFMPCTEEADGSLTYDSLGTITMAKMPKINGILRYDEVANDTIDHALAFVYESRKQATAWDGLYPSCARYVNGLLERPYAPLTGMRFYLDMTEDQINTYISTNNLSAAHASIMKAIKTYGMIFVEGWTQNFVGLYADAAVSTNIWNTLFDGDRSFSDFPFSNLKVIEPLRPQIDDIDDIDDIVAPFRPDGLIFSYINN